MVAGQGSRGEDAGAEIGPARSLGCTPTPVAVLCLPPSRSRELAPAPFYISGSLQVVVYQPKVICVVFWIFFLVFRFFFFKQSIFLGVITQKGPVGRVCVSRAPDIAVGA